MSFGYYSVVIDQNNQLWAWGHNGYGQLGDGTTTQRTIPTRIGTDKDWKQVACGSSHTVAIKQDGSLWAWGNNGNGQLGDGTTSKKTTPTKITSLSQVKALWGILPLEILVKYLFQDNGLLKTWVDFISQSMTKNTQIATNHQVFETVLNKDLWKQIERMYIQVNK
jgi:hypothetical protein